MLFYHLDTTQTFVGTNFVISGWGTTSSGGSQSGPLKAAFVSGMSNNVKNLSIYILGKIFNETLLNKYLGL